jgi:hypothetical protein
VITSPTPDRENFPDTAGPSSSSGDVIFGSQMPPILDEPYFEIMFTFHHCLGDGLSMYSFGRTFLEIADFEHMNSLDLKLEDVPVNPEPVPVLDNLFNPNVLQIVARKHISVYPFDTPHLYFLSM